MNAFTDITLDTWIQKKPIHNRLINLTKKFFSSLGYGDIEFPIPKSQHRIETKNVVIINIFGYESNQVHAISLSKESFENHTEILLMEILLIRKTINSATFMYNKAKHKEEGILLELFTIHWPWKNIYKPSWSFRRI